MKIIEICTHYFNGFQDASNYKKNDIKTNILAALKIFSYFTVLIPLGFVAAYGSASLYGRVSKKQQLFSHDKNMNDQAKKQLYSSGDSLSTNQFRTSSVQSKVIQNLDSKMLRTYTGDLNQLQKSKLTVNFFDENTLDICFQEVPTLNITIRKQNIFDSHAQVIINAANTHLGGGGGIDGLIHQKGGTQYKEAHQDLQKVYNSQYISGHAAMIESGLLKKDFDIDHVIVVAGPQGETSLQKENELYSCYYNSLVLAEDQKKTSIAFPSISTGIFGFSKERAASISLKAIYDFMTNYPNTTLKTISIHFLSNGPKADLENYQKAATF
jgi:O-acetyl-ADP-ribose deacetylase